ncbi:hypothetical protein LSM04_005272 [Trypanosoma melophagium]|uniref:uncharacterized protein n=1 Tax=Trypanosoma melophagium TaxID=715481 RepID=UPI00351AADE5|nr:hypothetical protein LSM04_005272 [Trypanosoma melophagium]
MEDSTFLPDITFSGTLSSSRPHTRSKKPVSGKKRHNVVVFPYYRDRLACDPQNTFCVYGNYEFRWGDPLTEAEGNIYALIDDMIAAAERAFDDAQKYWKQLPSSVQRAHILRTAIALTSSSPSPIFNAPLTQQTHPHTHTDPAINPTLMRHTPHKSTELSSSHIAVNISAAAPAVNTNSNSALAVARSRSGGESFSGRSPTTVTRIGRREEEDEAIVRELAPQWLPPINHTKCRIVLDIVASRKTLGDSPHSSEPYRLGQKAFKYAYTKYVSKVMTMFVGISDSAVTLVGRDVLFPYRATVGGATTNINNTLVNSDSTNVSFPSRVGVTRGAGTNRADTTAIAAALSYVEGKNPILSAGSFPTMSMTANIEQLIAATIPVPRIVMVPPVNTEKVDNVRLLVCFPLVDTELDDTV